MISLTVVQLIASCAASFGLGMLVMHFEWHRTTCIPAPVKCICGSVFVSDKWDAPTADGLVEIQGMTCPKKGCSGNLKEQHLKTIEHCKTGKRA